MGPNLGLDLVHTHEAVAEIANLGLVFLLFMIGPESKSLLILHQVWSWTCTRSFAWLSRKLEIQKRLL